MRLILRCIYALKNYFLTAATSCNEMADGELVACASSKKKAAQRRRIMSSSEEENYQSGRARAVSETSLGPKSAAMDDGVNDFEDETIACKHPEENTGKRKRRLMIPSDDEEDERLVKSRVLNLNYRKSCYGVNF